MNKNFLPGMVMLNGTISPGSSAGYENGNEGEEGLMYQDPETGETFIWDSDFNCWMGDLGGMYDTPLAGWEIVSCE